MPFKQLPVLYNAQGNLRTIGFELEYANLSIEESVQVVQQLFGGTVQKENRFKQQVLNSSLGDFTIEFDLTLLSEKRYRKLFDAFHIHPEELKVGNTTLEAEVEICFGRDNREGFSKRNCLSAGSIYAARGAGKITRSLVPASRPGHRIFPDQCVWYAH